MNILLSKNNINKNIGEYFSYDTIRATNIEEKKTENESISEKISNYFKSDNTDLIILTLSIFLIYLSLSTGFLSTLLGCQIYRFTNNNIYFRHFILLLFIYFAFDISSTFNTYIHPLITFIISLCIYLSFILFSKMTLFYTLIVLSLIILIGVINKFKRYYNNTLTDNEKKLKTSIVKLNKLENMIIILIIMCIMTGSMKYYFIKRKQYRNKFNHLRYFFGYLKCDKILS